MANRHTEMPERIRLLRIAQNLSQADLAERVGVAQSAISQFEAGTKTPRLGTLKRLASSLGISTSVLLGEEKEVSQ